MKGDCKFIKDGRCTCFLAEAVGNKCVGYEICEDYEGEE